MEVIDLRKSLKDFNYEKDHAYDDANNDGGDDGEEENGNGMAFIEGEVGSGGGNEGDEEEQNSDDSDNEHEDDNNKDGKIEPQSIPILAQLMPIVASANQRGRKRKAVQLAEVDPRLDMRRKVSRGGAGRERE